MNKSVFGCAMEIIDFDRIENIDVKMN